MMSKQELQQVVDTLLEQEPEQPSFDQIDFGRPPEQVYREAAELAADLADIIASARHETAEEKVVKLDQLLTQLAGRESGLYKSLVVALQYHNAAVGAFEELQGVLLQAAEDLK